MNDPEEGTPLHVRVSELAHQMHDTNRRNVDRMFVWLMVVQWFAGIATAAFVAPYTWIGSQSFVHQHLYAATIVGGLLSAAPIWFGVYYPGLALTRHVIAISQALWGALLIHLSGGRIETHFHVFGSLAFIAFYRDRSVLITMTSVVALDHAFRGLIFPLSVYGVFQESPLRWLEHVGWVLCEDIVLLLACRRGCVEVRQICTARAELELTNRLFEQRVNERTGELGETTEFFRSVLDSIHAHVCVLNADGKIVEANRLWRQADTRALRGGGVVGDNYFEHCQQLARAGVAGAAEVANAIQSVLADRQHRSVREFAMESEQETRWYQVNISSVLGHGRGAAVVARINVTERTGAEQELKTALEHLERLSLIAKYTDNAAIIMEPDGRIASVNEGFERLYGYKSREVLGLNPHDFLLGPGSDPEVVDFIKTQTGLGCGFDVEVCKSKKNGEPVWVSIEVRPIYSEAGELLRFISLARDITQKRASDQSLQLLREAVDNANDAIFIIDPDDAIVDANTTAARRLGCTRSELLQLSMSDIDIQFADDSMLQRWQEGAHGEAGGSVGTVTAKDGTTFPVEFSTAPVNYGGRAYFCAFAHDISERRKAEAEHDRLNVELQNAARQMGMAEVAADVLHNVGNALNSINVSIQSLQRQLNSKTVDMLTRATDTVWSKKDDLGTFLTTDQQGRMFPKLFQQLGQRLTSERERQGREVLELMEKIEHVKEVVASQKAFSHRRAISEALSPDGVFQEAVRMQSFSVVDAGVAIQTDFAAVEEVYLEKHLVMQILINLVKNAKESALQAEIEAPWVHLSTRVEGDWICFEVKDNGVGIAADNLVEIFQHGFTTKKTGHGFGLHSCANLAQEMGGTLTVHSDGIGCGAVFVLKLPLQRTNAEQPCAIS